MVALRLQRVPRTLQGRVRVPRALHGREGRPTRLAPTPRAASRPRRLLEGMRVSANELYGIGTRNSSVVSRPVTADPRT